MSSDNRLTQSQLHHLQNGEIKMAKKVNVRTKQTSPTDMSRGKELL